MRCLTSPAFEFDERVDQGLGSDCKRISLQQAVYPIDYRWRAKIMAQETPSYPGNKKTSKTWGDYQPADTHTPFSRLP